MYISFAFEWVPCRLMFLKNCGKIIYIQSCFIPLSGKPEEKEQAESLKISDNLMPLQNSPSEMLVRTVQSSENEGVQVVIQGLLKEKVFLISSRIGGRAIAPLALPVPTALQPMAGLWHFIVNLAEKHWLLHSWQLRVYGSFPRRSNTLQWENNTWFKKMLSRNYKSNIYSGDCQWHLGRFIPFLLH